MPMHKGKKKKGMAKGGATKRLMGGGMMKKKKGYARGGVARRR